MNTQDFKRKLTAVFSADVAGYSRLMGEDEAATVKTLEAYKQIMFSLIKQHRGRVIDSPGDNLLAEFASVVHAVQCGVAVQNELKARNADLPENRRMQFRIGINLGDVIEEQDRIYGDGVNIAARLESCADPGGICISKTAFDHIESKLPLGYEFLGEQQVKNIAKPVGAYRVLMEPRVTVAGAKEKKLLIPLWRRKGALIGTFAVLVLIAGVAVWHYNFRLPPIEPASVEKMAFPLPDKPSIAVLPFTNLSGDPAQEYFSDGITEDIITILSKVQKLFVISRTSTFTYKNRQVKIQQVAEELGVQYVLEGSVKMTEGKIRISAKLIDAVNGHHLWAERYDSDLKDIFALQDEVAMKVLAALDVELIGGRTSLLYSIGTKNLNAYLEVLQGREFHDHQSKENNLLARRKFEKAVELDPNYAAAFNLLARTHFMEFWFGTSKSPKESLMTAIDLAQKSIALDDSYADSYALLGYLYCLSRQYEKAIVEGERAVQLDPNSSLALLWLGSSLNYTGKHEESVAMTQKAIRLNPMPPSSWHVFLASALLNAGRYEEAVTVSRKAVTLAPNNLFAQLVLVGSCIRGGCDEEARNAAAEVLRIQPGFSLDNFAKRLPYKNQVVIERSVNDLRKAGLPDKPPLPLPDKPSIAVLPFVNMSDDKSQEYFSDGLTEDIITALSKTPKLFVIARNSTFVYKGKPVNVQQVSRELGVKYVLEGSVRRSGDQLRITAQLIDATTGNHLWAERYDREMKDIFAIQDEITMKIVTSFVQLTESEVVHMHGRHPSNLQAYLKLLEGIAIWNESKFSDSLKTFEKALSLDSQFPITYGWIAWAHMMNVWFGPSASRGQSLEKAFEYAGKAKEMAPDWATGPAALGHAYLLKRDYDKALSEGKLATDLVPNSTLAATYLGWTLRSVRRYEEAMKEYERALRLDPHNAFTLTHIATTYFMMKRYEESISACKKALERHPKSFSAHVTLAMAYSSAGKMDQAREAATNVLRINPNFSAEHFAKALPYKYEEDRAHMIEALRKAGLE